MREDTFCPHIIFPKTQRISSSSSSHIKKQRCHFCVNHPLFLPHNCDKKPSRRSAAAAGSISVSTIHPATCCSGSGIEPTKKSRTQWLPQPVDLIFVWMCVYVCAREPSAHNDSHGCVSVQQRSSVVSSHDQRRTHLIPNAEDTFKIYCKKFSTYHMCCGIYAEHETSSHVETIYWK